MRKFTIDLLKSKLPKIGEIEVTLFEYCNLHCSFCFHDVKSKLGLSKEEIFSKIPLILKHSKEINKNVNTIQLNMVGGELMIDDLINKGYLDIYYEFINNIYLHYQKMNINLRVVFVSNYLFNENNSLLIKEFIHKLRKNTNSFIGMIASYDFTGRPINNTWKRNLETLKNETVSINTVMTKPSLLQLMKKGDEYWENEIYPNFETFFDFFIPDKGSNHMIPEDSLLLEFYKWTTLNFPNINPINDMINSKEQSQSMSCLSLNKVTIFPDNSTSNCRWKRYTNEDYINELIYEDNSNMINDYLHTHNCFSCEYYQKCPFRCFTQWSWKGRIRDVEGCVNKHFFDFLKEQK